MHRLHNPLVGLLLLTAPALAQVVNAPCFEANLGTNLTLGDDQVSGQQSLGFTFPGPAGPVTDVWVSSNGFIWLSANTNSRCCSGYESAFLSDPPSIAAFWTDLYPPGAQGGGGVFFNSIPGTGGNPSRAIITWSQVPEYGSSQLITAQIQLLSTGEFVIFQDPNNGLAFHQALVGVTSGNNATPNPIDFASLSNAPINTGTLGSAYEEFDNTNYDIPGRSFEFLPNGQGGYILLERTQCRYAGSAKYGMGCPSPAVIYEQFAAASYDLSGIQVDFVPNGPASYVVLQGIANFVDPTRAGSTALNLGLGDDQVSAAQTLPWAFPYMNGVATSIEVSSNGLIYLQPGLMQGNSLCCSGDAQTFATMASAAIAPFWQDLNPRNGGGVYVEVDPSGAAYHITWYQVPEYPNTGANTVQLTLLPTGLFTINSVSAGNPFHDALVGFTIGNSPVVPPGKDYTVDMPFVTGAGGTPLALDMTPGHRPAIGQSCTLLVQDIPAGSLGGFVVFSLGRVDPGVDLSPVGMPGCNRYIDLTRSASNFITVNPPTASFVLTMPNNRLLIGGDLHAQAVTLSSGFTQLGLIASNGLSLYVGL